MHGMLMMQTQNVRADAAPSMTVQHKVLQNRQLWQPAVHAMGR
jgi:hypothetical protein